MAENGQTGLPNLLNLALDLDKTPNSFSLSKLNSTSEFLNYPWEFTTCDAFCETFGITNKGLLITVFEKIKNLTVEEPDSKIFHQLYQDEHTSLFIKTIIGFPEFKAFLTSQNADHCVELLVKRVSHCTHYKKQLSHIVSLFKTEPIKACVALVRFTQTAESLPEGEQKKQLQWLIEQTRQAWYKENYLIHHALNSPFLNAYLNTNPQWGPCIDFLLTIAKNNESLSTEHYSELLSLIHYHPSLFCEALSQTTVIHQFDLTLLDEFILKYPNTLEDLLKLTQHRIDRFTLWSNWVNLLPDQAERILIHWQNHLNHLSTEMDSQDKAFQNLLQSIDNGIIPLSSQSKNELEKTQLSIEALKKPDLTAREKDNLPDSKRHILSEMALLVSVKASCWFMGGQGLHPVAAMEIYNRKLASLLKTKKIPETFFNQVKYSMYAVAARPFSGNRIFEHTANESFKTTFLNGFKLFSKKGVGEQYYHHLKNPKMTDAEFYQRVLARP